MQAVFSQGGKKLPEAVFGPREIIPDGLVFINYSGLKFFYLENFPDF